MWNLIRDWGTWIAGISVLTFFVSLWFVTWLILRLPHDYFLSHSVGERQIKNQFSYVTWFLLRNALGLVLVVLGTMMLVLPGQGLITLILGLSMMTFPGKKRLERWILGRSSVRTAMNWIRRKAHKPPLVFDGESA